MIKYTYFIIHSYRDAVVHNMELLGWKILEETPVNYEKNMDVISETYHESYENASIHKIIFGIEDDLYHKNKEQIVKYFAEMKEEFVKPAKYKFAIPTIIISSVIAVYMVFLLFNTGLYPDGPFGGPMWTYFIFAVTYGRVANLQVPTYVSYSVLGSILLVAIALIIVYSIYLNKRKTQYYKDIEFNKNLEEKKANLSVKL